MTLMIEPIGNPHGVMPRVAPCIAGVRKND